MQWYSLPAMLHGGRGTCQGVRQYSQENQSIVSGSALERRITEGNNPVHENH